MPVDRDKVRYHINLLEEDIKILEEKRKITREEYLSNVDIQGLVERRLHTSIEGCINIGSHIIAGLGLKLAEDFSDVFRRLSEKGIISKELSERLIHMVKFRNLLVHVYWKIDPLKVYDYLMTGLEDLRQFSEEIVSYLDTIERY